MPGIVPQKFAAFNDTTTTNTSVVCTYAVSPGDCVVVIVGSATINTGVTSVTDTGGNSYTLRANNPTTAASSNQLYVSFATAAANSITVAWTAGGNHTVMIGTYGGVASVGSNTGINNGTGTAVSVPVTLASPNNFAIGALTCGSVAQTNWVGNIRQGATATLSIRTYLLDITGISSGAFSMNANSATNWTAAYIELVPSAAPVGIRPKLFTQFYTSSGPAFPSTAIAFPIAVGDCVVVFFSTQLNASVTTYTISDDGGNTYTQETFILSPGGNGPNITCYATIATATATQLTLGITATTVGSLSFLIQSYLGVSAIGSNFGGVTTGSASQVLSTINGTLANVNNFMVAEVVFKSSLATVIPFTVSSGTLRAYFTQPLALGNQGTQNQMPFVLDNTGSLAETCAVTSNTAAPNSGVYIELVPFAPVLTSINPNVGNTGSTVPVTITGTNLTGTAAISVTGGGVTVTNIVVVNSTTVTANFVIASGATLGAVSVSVATSVGPSNSITFTIQSAAVAPTLSSISPNFGVQENTVPVTITGKNFSIGGAPTINFSVGGIGILGNVTVVNDTTITANFSLAQSAPVGVQQITVTNSNGTSNPVSFEVQNALAPAANLLPVAATLTLINN